MISEGGAARNHPEHTPFVSDIYEVWQGSKGDGARKSRRPSEEGLLADANGPRQSIVQAFPAIRVGRGSGYNDNVNHRQLLDN
jgi:hypothetical protein